MFTNANICYKQMPYMNNYINLGSYQIKILNESSMPIIFKLSYYVGGVPTEIDSPSIDYGSAYSIELPQNSSRITIIILNNSDPQNPDVLYRRPLFYSRNACYRLSGTSVSSTLTEVPCSSLDSSGNIYNNCCCCCCCMCNCN